MKIENGMIKAVIDEILQLESTEIINLFNKLMMMETDTMVIYIMLN